MFELITNNFSTIVISALILVVVVKAIRSLVENKGGSNCAGTCSSCASSNICHVDLYKLVKSNENKK